MENEGTEKSAEAKEQVRKVLSTRKSPAYLLTLYGKPRLCINIHYHAPPIGFTAQRLAGSAAHRAATSLAAEGRCAGCGVSEGSTSSFKSIT